MSEGVGVSIWERIHRFLNEPIRPDVPEDVLQRELRDLWRERARELSRPAQEAQDSILWEKLLILKVGKERYALRVHDVEEIIRVPAITPVPCVPVHFRGVINRRGTILPIVDMRLFFDGTATEQSRENRIIVLSRNRYSLGILAEGADKFTAYPTHDIKPPIHKGEGVQNDFCEGVVTIERRMILLVDTAKLLADDRMTVDRMV